MLHFIKNNKFKSNSQRGFTLIELMVATTIFMSVMLMAMGSLIIAMNGVKKAQALRVSMDNVNFAMETMSRNLRTGMNFYCANAGDNVDLRYDTLLGKDCPNGQSGTAVAFRPATYPTNLKIVRTLYKKDGTKLVRCETGDTDPCPSIVADNVTVDTLQFYVKGTADNDSIQPSVYIKMEGSVSVKGVPTPFAIQTLASQRVVY